MSGGGAPVDTVCDFRLELGMCSFSTVRENELAQKIYFIEEKLSSRGRYLKTKQNLVMPLQ